MARYFPGTITDYLGGVSFLSGSGSFTATCWVRLDKTSGTYVAFTDRSNSSLAPIRFQLRSINGVLESAVRDNSINIVNPTASPSLQAGRWYHIGSAYDAASKRLDVYINGVSRGNATNAAITNTFSTNTTTVGGTTVGVSARSFPWLGQIGHPSIWSTLLTASQMSSLASGASPHQVAPDFLTAYWPLMGGSGGPELDLVQARQLTVVGTTWAPEPIPTADPPIHNHLDSLPLINYFECAWKEWNFREALFARIAGVAVTPRVGPTLFKSTAVARVADRIGDALPKGFRSTAVNNYAAKTLPDPNTSSADPA